jgi:hypothetical protein
MKRFSHKRLSVRLGLIAGSAVVVAGIVGTGMATASASSASRIHVAPAVESLSIANYPSTPTITINGTGFGNHAPSNGVSPSTLANCNSGTGLDYPKSELWLLDASRSDGLSGAFQEGSEASSSEGNCGGIIISSWSNTKIMYTLGSRYTTDGAFLDSGDTVCVDVKLVPACTTLA